MPAQPNESLIDGLACLQAIAVSPTPVGGRELARRLGMNPMRVNRLLKTLAFLGIARQTSDRRYTAGAAMHVLSVQSLYASGLLRRALDAMDLLPHQEHSVAIGVLWQDQVCYLLHTDPGQNPAAALGAHSLYPSTCSSIGMAILASQRPSQIRRLYAKRDIPGFTEGLPALQQALAEVRRAGHAYVVQSRSPYQASVAVPIGAPAYAGVALAHHMTQAKAARWLPALKAAAARIAGES